MREIKFRAWDESQQYMAYQGTPDLETIQSFIYHFGNKELLQFTGLHDKNGREIYEGDILKSGNGEGISFVVWVLDRWRFNSWMPYSMNLYDHVNKTNGKPMAEVIGNIYENLELLNQNIEK